MANALVDLTTLDAAKAHLTGAGVALPSDAALEILITEVSVQLQAYLGRSIVLQAHTQRFSGHGGDRVMVPHQPIVSVESVSVSGESIKPAASDADCYGFAFDNALIGIRGGCFARGIANCVINYTAGYDPVPDDIRRACNEAIRAGLETFGADAGGLAIKYKAGDTEIVRGDLSTLAHLCVTPAITSALDPYRRVAPC